MSFAWRTAWPRFAAAAVAVLGTLIGLAALPVASSADPSIDQLSSELQQQQSRQQTLQGSIGGLSQLIDSLSGQIALVQSREAAVQADLDRERAALATTQASLQHERQLLVVLRARLAQARRQLARQLVSNYESDSPDLVSVILESNGFNDLLERIKFLRDAERQQQTLIKVTRVAKHKADSAANRLAKLEAADRAITAQTALRARALVGMDSLLSSKQEAMRQARAVQQSALSASQAKGEELQSKISELQAQQSASQGSTSSAGPALGPSDGWAIPFAIVMCESGGQNLPPNSAGASGYYQIIPSTWQSFGGTGPAAYLASKAEQDAVASRIWNGGAGASDWDCAAMVGIH